MAFASIVLDIPTRALDGAYSYRIPPELAETVAVGATVLVDFSRRAAVGYVMALSNEAPAGIDHKKILDIRQVLAPSAFDEAAEALCGAVGGVDCTGHVIAAAQFPAIAAVRGEFAQV